MGFDKVVDARIFGTTNQITTCRLPIGDSTGGTFTPKKNPLRGTLLWDRGMYVLHGVSVAGGATGGSYTVTVETDALADANNLPIARASGIGPLTKSTVVLDNLHQSPASPLPTHLRITQDAAGGGIWLQCDVIARQYRGTLGTPGNKSSERVLQGIMMRGASYAGGAFTDSRGMTEDTTFTIGTSCNDLGMHRMRLWDTALFWVSGGTLSGTHDVDIVAKIRGVTTSIASTGAAGAIATADTTYAIANNFYGQCPNPSNIIWTEVSAGGVSDARVIGIAKSGRGSMGKR